MNETARPPMKLTPPFIPAALKGGLGHKDLVDDPTSSVVVGVGPWTDFLQGDIVEILLGPEKVSFAERAYETSDALVLLIPVPSRAFASFGEGVTQVCARVTGRSQSSVFESPPLAVHVKLGVPGGLDPNPVTPNINENLSNPAVTPTPIPDNLEGVVVTVPPYENMAVGDRVSVQWNRMLVPRAPLIESEVGSAVQISIDRDVVLDGAGGVIDVRYQVHDRVANWSHWSPASSVEIPPDEATAPPAPWVKGTIDEDGRAIDLAALGSRDIHVRVKDHSGEMGERIAVRWAGRTSLGKPVVFESEPQVLDGVGQTLDFTVPNRKAKDLAGSTASASYSIQRGQQVRLRSRVRRVELVGADRVLDAPSVKEASDGAIDLGRVLDAIHVVINAWDGIEPKDRCYVEWEGTRADGTHTYRQFDASGSELDANRQLVVEVPVHELEVLYGGRVRIRYTVALQADAWHHDGIRSEPFIHLESPWISLTVPMPELALSIDSTPATLSGKITRLVKRVTVPPEGTFMARVATGGVPPYRYASNSGAVEVDEATGRVVSLRNGTALVTVTDAKGATASYPVTVSHVSHLVDLDRQGGWDIAVSLAGQHKAGIPTLDDWDGMRAAYGGVPGVRADAGWSSVQADKFHRYAVFPNTGAREARRFFGLGSPLQSAWIWVVTTPTV
ncbi:hypothetical protein ABIE56_004224 [Luteibacter sp. 621]|uniref:hypothetical protein n=1 Tax=Luteibacter sp. 621 TaxID=3373916 RepID=UPI003D19480D